MKKREVKMNKEQKEVKPVKNSVALILTIVTVLAFAAACFSLGFCSGKKVEHAYAIDVSVNYYYYFNEAISGNSGQFMGDFQCNGKKYSAFVNQSYGELLYEAYDGEGMISDQLVVWTSSGGWIDDIYRYIYIESALLPAATAQWLSGNSVNTVDATLYAGNYTWKEELNLSVFSSTFLNYLLDFSSDGNDFVAVGLSSTMMRYRYKSDPTKYIYVYDLDGKEHWGSYGRIITISEETLISPDFYDIFFANMASFSPASVSIVYTLTIQFEGEGFTHTATPTGTSEKISDNVFECDTGSGAYVAIGPQDDYIIEEISYNVDSGVATIQESGVNGYRVLRDSGNAVVTFTVTTKTDFVVISSGYYWLRSFGSPPNYSTRYSIAKDDFQAIRSIVDGEVVWESLAGFIPYDEYSPWFYFESAPATKVQVFAPGSYRITSVPSGVSNPYSSPVALWHPVIYIPEDIKQSRGYSSTLVSFMTGGVYAYKSDIQYYNAFYIELPSTQASIPTSLPSGLSGVTVYTPSQNTLISPQSVNLQSLNNVSTGAWTLYYTVDFAGRPDYGEYTGAWFGIEGGRKRSVYNQTEPFYVDGNIYINSTVMPTSVYSFLNSAFNISSVPIDVDPPSADYWIGLDTVLSYQIFGIPLSVLLAVVISSVFVVVVIRLFAGG